VPPDDQRQRMRPGLLRLVGSIHVSAVGAHDVLRMLQHGGNPTQLGQALAQPCKKAAMSWRGTSSTAVAVISGRPTSRTCRTSPGRRDWS